MSALAVTLESAVRFTMTPGSETGVKAMLALLPARSLMVAAPTPMPPIEMPVMLTSLALTAYLKIRLVAVLVEAS